jgi:hypothetical protein
MTVWKLKSCLRCSGDIYIDKDFDGWYEHCLQCGYMRPVSEPGAMQIHGAGNREKQMVGAGIVKGGVIHSTIASN